MMDTKERTKKALLKKFALLEKESTEGGDPINPHIEATDFLLAYIGDKEITEAFEKIRGYHG